MKTVTAAGFKPIPSGGERIALLGSRIVTATEDGSITLNARVLAECDLHSADGARWLVERFNELAATVDPAGEMARLRQELAEAHKAIAAKWQADDDWCDAYEKLLGRALGRAES